MITEQDVRFHTPTDDDPTWGETNYFPFMIPEHNLVGAVYVVMRQPVGVCVGEVVIFNRLSGDRMDVLYFDSNQQMRLPDDLADYALDNGIRVRVTDAPRSYRIDYEGVDDTELHLELNGLMDPYDIHDPAMCPTAPPAERAAEGSGFGTAYSGHFDMTARVTGTLRLYGETFTIDCLDTMDHSWGPRPVRDMHTIGWGHAHFGEDLCCHAIWQAGEPSERADRWGLVHGYVLEDGAVTGLTSGRMDVTRHDEMLTSARVEVMDARGRTHTMTGRTVSSDVWHCYTALEVRHLLLEWESGGRVGHGVIQETYPVQRFARARNAARVREMAQALAPTG